MRQRPTKGIDTKGGKKRFRLLFYHYFLVALSFYILNAWFVYHTAVGNQIDEIKQDESPTSGFSVPNFDVCRSFNESSSDGGLIGESVYYHWKFIDETVNQEFPDARVSGGIFLYPRQSSILTHLIQKIHAGQIQYKKTITICETGYGSGHSMALFQDASASIGPVRVISFDKFDRPYQLPIWHSLNETISTTYNNKRSFDFVKGDSCKTVPKYLPSFQCDILHGSSLCRTDNIDLVENSPCGVLLTSTAMNSLKDRQVYFGKNAQWRKLKERNCISNIVCFREDGTVGLKRDFVFAKKGSTPTGEFCIAVTTGRCQSGEKDSETTSKECVAKIDQLLTYLNLKHTCPMHQIEMPV